MTPYYYFKSQPISSSKKGQPRLISLLAITLGALMITVVLGSVLVYQLRSVRYFQKQVSFLSPLPAQAVLGQSEADSSLDYTQPGLWFSEAPPLLPKKSKITHYNLSVPALGIAKAVVEIGGEDLGKSMVHYLGSTLPGERGTATVLCHSVLPQFFNPKNYKTICSTLPTLKIGDEILIYFDGINYAYQVIEMTEVQPDEIAVLTPDMSGEYLNMITCVPPGTYLRRLVVKARLI
jgi:sortase A